MASEHIQCHAGDQVSIWVEIDFVCVFALVGYFAVQFRGGIGRVGRGSSRDVEFEVYRECQAWCEQRGGSTLASI